MGAFSIPPSVDYDLCRMGNKQDAAIDWQAVRADYPGLVQATYLDTASLGLLARSTADAAIAEQDRLMGSASARFVHWHAEGRAAVGRQVAAHIGGEAAGTVLLPSFTTGMARLAPLLRHRGKVLLVGGDYPTLHAPFRWNGFEAVVLEPLADGSIPLDLLADAVARERPQLVAISHVQWATGHRIDLHALTALCRAHGAWSVVDATQSWCCVPIDLREAPVDILGASGYKWPLAGMGNGFFHLAGHVREELAARNGFDALGALAEGHVDPVALVRLADALERSAGWGAKAVSERVEALCGLAVERLGRAGVQLLSGHHPDTRGGILIIAGGADRLARMQQAGVQAQLRGAGIRVGVHFYNNEADVERLVASVAEG